MKKQTTIYLSDKDQKKLNKIKETLEADTNNEVFKKLIQEEYERILKYTTLTE